MVICLAESPSVLNEETLLLVNLWRVREEGEKTNFGNVKGVTLKFSRAGFNITQTVVIEQ